MSRPNRVSSALRAWWREYWAALPHFAVTMSGWVPLASPGGIVAGPPDGWTTPAGGPPPGWAPPAAGPAGRNSPPTVPAPRRDPDGGRYTPDPRPGYRPAPPLSRRERRAWAALTGSTRLTSGEDPGRADPPVRR
ncbi:hypothetical protein [Micromonospora sp. CA-244673]|uniref:hypothetical protein n=1 Tax=Micromonospora sp. CA-244673 TaxID=3239958 RepID=UPI003D90836D